MPRKYKKVSNRVSYTSEQFEAAKEALKNTNIRKVSKDFNIPYTTLQRWRAKPNLIIGTGKMTILNDIEEGLIVSALEFTAKCGFPQGRDDIKNMVQSYVKHTGKHTPFRDGRPGRDWVVLFERRHKARLKRRKPEYLTKARSKGMTKKNVQTFYNLYEDVLKEHDLFDKPWVLFNIDETGLTCDKTDTKVYIGADTKNAYSLGAPGAKTMYTVLFGVSAIGQYLPPFTVYKAKSLWGEWTNYGVDGACYGVSDSGWMTDVNFESWMIKIFIPQTKHLGRPLVLTYDGHNSHLTYVTVKAAMDDNIIIICLPPNTSHALQPLDVGVFRSVKATWKKVLIKWFSDTRLKSVDKTIFPSLLKQLWSKLNPNHAVNGFKSCGLHPLNKKAVDHKILLSDEDPPPPQAPHGPRSTTRAMQAAILNTLCPPIEPDAQAALANSSRKRTRVQCVSGEVLTRPEVLERLKVEEENRKKKQQKQQSKPGTSKVSITMKNVPASKSKDTVKPKIQKSLSHFGLTVEKKSLYKEVSDSDIDDPKEDPKESQKSIMIKQLKPNVYVIICYEESYFPGLVVRVKKSEINVKCMSKTGLATWSWPKQDDLHDYTITDIIEIIDSPTMANNRGDYFVPEIEKYWK